MEISSIALQGMHQAEMRLDGAARRVAAAVDPTDNVDLSAEAVAMMEARNAFEANANVAGVANQMQRDVIDLLA